MKCIGIWNGNKKDDNSEYCWIYYTKENKYVTGLECDKKFFRKHQDLNVGDEFEFTFVEGKNNTYYANGVKKIG